MNHEYNVHKYYKLYIFYNWVQLKKVINFIQINKIYRKSELGKLLILISFSFKKLKN